MSPTEPKNPAQPTAVEAELEAAPGSRAELEPGVDAGERLQDLLDQVADAPGAELETAPAALPAVTLPANVALRTAVPVAIRGRVVTLRCRGVDGELQAELAPGVSRELVAQAIANGDAILLESVGAEAPVVVGIVQSRLPVELTLRARQVHIEADEELLLRSGRGALRIRQDGEVEIVGSRISALSRGLFRLVGRMLRLN
jgi:hypothetical protein